MGTFKDHFSGHADTYAAARPGYPDALYAWLASQCRATALVWDAGCGNGQASKDLARYFDQVFASDPSATQIASACAVPNIRYAVEPAEQCSLPDDSTDCICVAQALHWFDFALFFSQARRVLKKDGLLVVWTYERSSVSEPVDAVFKRLYGGTLDQYWPGERKHVETAYREIRFPFIDITVPELQLSCQWNLAQYLAYLRSWSASQRYFQATGVDAVGLIEDDMRRAWGNPEEIRTVLWPLTIRAGRF